MVAFVGRERELATLTTLLRTVASEVGSSRPGRCLLIRGRRRIGKSSLVEAFVDRADVPTVFFAAAGASADVELEALREAVAGSTLPDRAVFADAVPGNWSAALRQLAGILPDDRPSVVVVDEVPYLMDRVDAFEGVLQRAWDRELSRRPVLLVLIGSDLSMMEALGSYGRPFHQRGQEMVLGPLNPAEVGQMLRLAPAEAFDAALVTGGLPLICAAWQPGDDLWAFLGAELANPVSALLVSAERFLAAEVPGSANARDVLSVIGGGERTFTSIARAAGGITHTSLTRSIDVLVAKRIVTGELPLWTRPSKDRRYRVTDPYLRFWLRFIGPYLPEIERLRGDLTLQRIRDGWTAWRGRAVEPLLRESLARLLPDGSVPAAAAVGAYWNRSSTIEIDIVGADREPIARDVHFLGSIKWLERSPFDSHDLAVLQKHRAALTDDPLTLVAVSRSGVTATGLAASYGPAELLAAGRPHTSVTAIPATASSRFGSSIRQRAVSQRGRRLWVFGGVAMRGGGVDGRSETGWIGVASPALARSRSAACALALFSAFVTPCRSASRYSGRSALIHSTCSTTLSMTWSSSCCVICGATTSTSTRSAKTRACARSACDLLACSRRRSTSPAIGMTTVVACCGCCGVPAGRISSTVACCRSSVTGMRSRAGRKVVCAGMGCLARGFASPEWPGAGMGRCGCGGW